jgi:hypothetical protein
MISSVQNPNTRALSTSPTIVIRVTGVILGLFPYKATDSDSLAYLFPLLTHSMYSHPNMSYPGTGTYRPYSYQYPTVDPLPLPSMSTIALQDIVEGQQRATSGLVTLLSQERTTAESTTREHKQQLSNMTSLSQHFLLFMPDVEQKLSALESEIRTNACTNCLNPESTELQARLKDMLEVVANLGRIAEGFACSTGLRLVPVRSNATIPDVPEPVY